MSLTAIVEAGGELVQVNGIVKVWNVLIKERILARSPLPRLQDLRGCVPSQPCNALVSGFRKRQIRYERAFPIGNARISRGCC